MQTSQGHQGSGGVHGLYHHHHPAPQFEIIDNNVMFTPNNPTSEKHLSFTDYTNSYFTLDSSPAPNVYNIYDSPSLSTTTFSPQRSHSYFSDHTSDSPASGSSVVDDDHQLKTKLRELELFLVGPESAMDTDETSSLRTQPRQDLKQVLILCAQAVSNEEIATAVSLMDTLGKMVSISGTPIQRLSAYLMEGLKARLEFSGFNIYKKMKCDPPTGSELLSYMHILYQICPYYPFAYTSSNIIISEAMQDENRIHIIDFQIAMGSQWIPFIQSISKRPGGPPFVRLTGVDDSNSAHARGGGLEIVARNLAEVAQSLGVPFEFHAAAMSGCQVRREDLVIVEGEALAVTFPYMLHHMPDESVSTENHRDRLLRLIKGLSPKVVTVLEQESNTNTTPFFLRFLETLDYYTAMFESIDVARERDDRERINAEQHCLARDIVNVVACEGSERVERHELMGKWKSRLSMAGFDQCCLSSSVQKGVLELMKGFHQNYVIKELDRSLYLGWKNRFLSTCSAWR